jgi:enterochelin esterase family protein
MKHLPGTDVWYRTYEVPRRLRTTYQLALNDPLTPLWDAADFVERTAHWQPDPLNARTFSFPRDEEDANAREVTFSVVELSDAAPQPWLAPHPDIPAGTLTCHRFTSDVLGNARRVWLCAPPGYHPDRVAPYPAIVAFDGLAATGVIPMPTILDNLIAAGRIPPVPAVLVDSLDRQTRLRELLCHEPFHRFLVGELLSWLLGQAHSTGNPAQTLLVGQSGGELAAAFAALGYPDRFELVLSQSGAYWWAPPDVEPCWLTREFVAAPTYPLRLYMDAGHLERNGDQQGGPSLRSGNRHLPDVLLAKGYSVRYAEFSGGHDYLGWRGTIADGLIALLGDDPD